MKLLQTESSDVELMSEFGNFVDAMRVVSDSLCVDVRPIHVRAQRKFAASVTSSPCGSAAVSSPSDMSTADQSPVPTFRKLLAGRRVTTDDFLTFLCLRGLSAVPNCCVHFHAKERGIKKILHVCGI